MKTQSIIIIVVVVLVIIIAAWFAFSQRPANDKISDITNDLNQVPNDSVPNQGLESLNQSIQNF